MDRSVQLYITRNEDGLENVTDVKKNVIIPANRGVPRNTVPVLTSMGFSVGMLLTFYNSPLT
jgi:hypothetical protein